MLHKANLIVKKTGVIMLNPDVVPKDIQGNEMSVLIQYKKPTDINLDRMAGATELDIEFIGGKSL